MTVFCMDFGVLESNVSIYHYLLLPRESMNDLGIMLSYDPNYLKRRIVVSESDFVVYIYIYARRFHLFRDADIKLA